jgi:site-specific DNA-cytosine methylase
MIEKKVIEFFAGSRSIGKVAEKMGYKVFSTDIKPFKRVDYVEDILKFDFKKVPFVPDILWFSPPCTAFSVASIPFHWRDGKPISKTAKLGVKLLEISIEIIKHYQRINPKVEFFIENPRGMMRKMPQLAGYKRHTVTYCQYGHKNMKPTDIWTNSKKFVPKMCEYGAPCHTPAPRGSRTGTQGQGDAFERSKIPSKLCKSILLSCR